MFVNSSGTRRLLPVRPPLAFTTSTTPPRQCRPTPQFLPCRCLRCRRPWFPRTRSRPPTRTLLPTRSGRRLEVKEVAGEEASRRCRRGQMRSVEELPSERRACRKASRHRATLLNKASTPTLLHSHRQRRRRAGCPWTRCLVGTPAVAVPRETTLLQRLRS